MILRHWFTTHEAQSLALRGAGVAVAALTGLISIKVFLATHPREAPGLIAMAGWLGFLPLLQLGLGRPLYSILRRRFVGRQAIGAAVRRALSWFATLALVAVAAQAVLGAWIVARHGDSVGWIDVGLLAAGLAANGTAAFQRDLAYAISREDGYERMELLRRIAVLCGYGALWAGAPMVAVGTVLVAVGAVTQGLMAHDAVAAHPRADDEQPLVGIGPDARRYLMFSLNELLLYNLPLVVFTLAAAGPELIFVGIWTRLFQFAVLPMRMLVDARVNRQTAAWFEGRIGALRHELAVSLGLAGATVAIGLVILAGVAAPLLRWLGSPSLTHDTWLLAGVAVWAIGNAVQHVYGAFTLSHGGGFGFALVASLGAALVTSLVFSAMQAGGFGVGPSLAAMGCAYVLSAFAYRVHVQRLLSRGTARL